MSKQELEKPPENKENLQRQSLEFERVNPTTPALLLGGQVFPREHLSEFGQEIYAKVGDYPWQPFISRDNNGEAVEAIIIGPQITGQELCGLFYAGAPSKRYGGSGSRPFDRNDTKTDWTELFDPDDWRQKNRLERHRNIPGWLSFENRRLDILPFIVEDHLHVPDDSSDEVKKLTPVIRIDLTIPDEPHWIFDDLTPDEIESLQPLVQDRQLEPTLLVPVLGPVLVGSYAPDITHAKDENIRWGTRSSIPRHTGTQDMGPTQFLPLALWKSQDLFESVLMKQLLQYIRTQEIRNFELPEFQDGVVKPKNDNSAQITKEFPSVPASVNDATFNNVLKGYQQLSQKLLDDQLKKKK